MPKLISLDIADPPDVWSELGFAVTPDGRSFVDGVRHDLGGSGTGVTTWKVAGVTATDGAIDGLPTTLHEGVYGFADAPHPNGVIALDHLVISTPNLGRTIERFEESGMELRRIRDAGTMQQAFFRLEDVILEVVGPPKPNGDGPARFLGIAWTSKDLDATGAYLGDRMRAPKDAVQPGRQIATLDKAAGSSVAMVFMSPGALEYD